MACEMIFLTRQVYIEKDISKLLLHYHENNSVICYNMIYLVFARKLFTKGKTDNDMEFNTILGIQKRTPVTEPI